MKATKKSNKTAAKKTNNVTIFGFSVAAVLRRLGKAGLKPLQALAAIRKHGATKYSVAAVRTWVQAGRSGERGTPAALSKTQLAQLLKAGATAKA